ncbi:MAG: deoxyribonuclease IV [Acidimicrobiia bacterium]|nr:deoxyribonuclease IV [Acidimicrobiia bacterium]
MRAGVHTSIAKSLEEAALHAHRLGCDTFQIFSASPRMWRASMPSLPAIARLRHAREKHNLHPLVIHDNYLINLASADTSIRKQSIAAFRGELERAILIGAEYLVAHPGSYKNQSLEQALLTLSDSLAEASRGIRSTHLTLLLENTAGQGSAIGSRIEELAAIRHLAINRIEYEIGFCLDTAHLLAAGYNIATAAGLKDTLAQAEAVLPLDRIHVIHANDSKAPLGSRIDRHQHIGKGHIGEDAFRRIVRHPKLRHKAFILETPIDDDGDDERNLSTLRRLAVAHPHGVPRRDSSPRKPAS